MKFIKALEQKIIRIMKENTGGGSKILNKNKNS